MKTLIFLVVCATFYARGEGSLTPFIEPCYSWDTECLRKSTQNALPIVAAGIPGLGMKSLDPMKIPRVYTNQAGLQMDFRDTVVKGLRKCQVLKVKRFSDRTKMDIKCSVTLIGDYSLGGHLLIMPIEGEGKYKINIRDIIVKIDLHVSQREAAGENYWVLDTWSQTSEVQTKVKFSFQNLFGGNTQLSSAIHDFANNNWRDIFEEMSSPIVEEIVSNIVGEIRKLFDAVPISDLSLD